VVIVTPVISYHQMALMNSAAKAGYWLGFRRLGSQTVAGLTQAAAGSGMAAHGEQSFSYSARYSTAMSMCSTNSNTAARRAFSTSSSSYSDVGSLGAGGSANPLSRELEQQISQLDVGTRSNSPTAPNAATRQKLQKPLEGVEKKKLTTAQQGALEATAEDLQDILTEVLSTPNFHNLFKGAQDPSRAVYIHHVRLNADCSHAHVQWKSDVLEIFVRKTLERMGEEEAKRLIKRAIKYISSKLQNREAHFRSQVIRQMHFRRVPRLFFEPWDSNCGAPLGSRSKSFEKDGRRAILRAKAQAQALEQEQGQEQQEQEQV